MPWKGVTVSEQRQRFLEDYRLSYYSITELAERFRISRKMAHKWINRHKEHGQRGFHERSRHPHSCPFRTDPAMVDELAALRKKHSSWGPRKLLDVMQRRKPRRELPSVSTAARILAREGWRSPGGATGERTSGDSSSDTLKPSRKCQKAGGSPNVEIR